MLIIDFKINKDNISILLEMISFFLVTVDLYGTERISDLQKKLRGRIVNIKFSKMMNPIEGINIIGYDVGMIIVGVLLFFTFYFAGSYDPIAVPVEKFMDGINRLLWPLIIIPVLILLAYLYTVIILAPFFIYYSIIYIIQLVLLKIVHIVKTKNLEGLLVSSGAILFMVSKFILLFG